MKFLLAFVISNILLVCPTFGGALSLFFVCLFVYGIQSPCIKVPVSFISAQQAETQRPSIKNCTFMTEKSSTVFHLVKTLF